MLTIKHRGKRKETGEWVEGAYSDLLGKDALMRKYIDPKGRDYVAYELIDIEIKTLGLYTNHLDINGNELFQGDIIKSQYDGTVMEIKFGNYEAYCPVDKNFSCSIGFYVSADKRLDMPLGPTERYAIKIGNRHDIPNLVEVIR